MQSRHCTTAISRVPPLTWNGAEPRIVAVVQGRRPAVERVVAAVGMVAAVVETAVVVVETVVAVVGTVAAAVVVSGVDPEGEEEEEVSSSNRDRISMVSVFYALFRYSN